MLLTRAGVEVAKQTPRVEVRLWGGPGRRRADVRVDAIEHEDLLTQVSRASFTREPLLLMSANLHWAALSAEDARIAELGRRFDLALLDSTPLRWLLEAQLGRPVAKLAGSDIVPQLCRWSAETGRGLFFLGGAPGVGERAAEQARRDHPGANVVGTLAPATAEIDDPAASREICQRINAARPDVLLVALGMPRQERWIVRHGADLEVPVRFGVGASLDFLAGVVPRAPQGFQDAGLEWAWRLGREPRRLWRRYLVEDLPYGLGIASQLVRRRAAAPPSELEPPTPLPVDAIPASRAA